MAGDEIVKVDGSKVYFYNEVTFATMYNNGEPLSLKINRDGKTLDIVVTPEYSEEYGRMMMGISFGEWVENPSPLQIIKYSFLNVRYWVKITLSSLKMLFTGIISVNELSGPVGITQTVSDVYDEASEYGFKAVLLSLMDLLILISANLEISIEATNKQLHRQKNA